MFKYKDLFCKLLEIDIQQFGLNCISQQSFCLFSNEKNKNEIQCNPRVVYFGLICVHIDLSTTNNTYQSFLIIGIIPNFNSCIIFTNS